MARVEQSTGEAVEVSATDVGALLGLSDWHQVAAVAAGPRHRLDELDYAPLVPRPGKIVCVGQNYKAHLAEQGIEAPKQPTLFAKFSSALTGANDNIVLPLESDACDWEVELAVVIGSPARRTRPEDALSHVAGYAVINDVSMRDWQFRTGQFLQGKTFDRATPLGPWLVTRDEPGLAEDSFELYCSLDGEVVQQGSTSDLLFSVPEVISYISHAMTLLPGDVVATGTPGGSGHWRQPRRYLQDGQLLVTGAKGLGEAANRCRREARQE